MSQSSSFLQYVRRRSVRRGLLAMLLAGAMSIAVALFGAERRNAVATARLNSAAEQLDALTAGTLADNHLRAAIAWGYAERLRVGLESPFRLIEAAARDPRLTLGEQRTVSWGLLARVLRGTTHEIDPAALDQLGPSDGGRSVAGEQHLALIGDAVVNAENPRAAELAVRIAYTLASAERVVEGAAPLLAAEAAAMLADRELARREAKDLVRASGSSDPIEAVRRRRERRALYVERPIMLVPDGDIEDAAIALAAPLLDALRTMRPNAVPPAPESGPDESGQSFARPLFAAGELVPPAAPLVVTVQRYLPLLRTHAPRVDAAALARARNGEMLVAVARAGGETGGENASRVQRRTVGRLLLAAAVSMRLQAQEPVWFTGDSVPTALQLASTLGLAGIAFDADVPPPWRPYYLSSLARGLHDLRRVLPSLRLQGVRVRFRMNAPADSALAMHDPRTRTLHLPISTAGGTLSHEIAHDLDRQSAQEQGLAGYRSDIVARVGARPVGRNASASGRVAASLRAITEELSESPRPARARAERPAEIFATRVDWFVAQALAREGISSGFLSAVQDELLTGYVVQPERLRNAGRSRSLLTALEGMTAVAPLAARDHDPSLQTLLRWSLAGPVDRRVAAEIVLGDAKAWAPARLIGNRSCDDERRGRVALVRMAAESRARGWLRLRARWTPEPERAAWARAMLRQGPWSDSIAERRVAQLRDYILVQLAASEDLPAGVSAYASSLAAEARCATEE